MKKVLIITYYWPPSGGAGVQRSLKFVKYLPEFGIEPIVITVDRNQATYPILDESLLKEVKENVRVIRTRSFEPLKILSALKGKDTIPHGGFANNNKETITQKTLRFIRGNFFLPDARLGWVRFAVKAASDIIEKEKVDTVFISSPPHSSQLIGLELKKKYKIRWIADMRDPWTDIYYYHDLLHTKYAAKRDAVYERQVLENADEVISVSDPINKLFLAKSEKLRAEKFHVIPNGFDRDDFNLNNKAVNKKLHLAYVGTMADNYRPLTLFKAIKKLVDEFSLNKDTIAITLVGSSATTLNSILQETELTALTEFIPHVDHASAIEFMQKADILLLIIPDVENNEGILTGKLFEYLGAGKPIIGLGPVKGKAAGIINECKAGKLVERHELEELYLYMKDLYLMKIENKEFRLNESAVANYSRESLTKKLADIIKS